MDTPQISVVVASHGRPTWLARCLTALGQLDYPAFEVVIAADSAGLAAVAAHPLGDCVKTVRCEVPNISATRNAGVARAAGDIVAFIDDDAVPEPLWLRHHAAALAATGAPATVGYVRGRNGISYQSRAASVDATAQTHTEPAPDSTPTLPDLAAGRALKLIGTNLAIRRSVLSDVGGFDPAYRFFLDDSDLSMRLSQAGHRAAIAPLAEVHHAVAPSIRRSAARFPRQLHDIGRSTAIYLARHFDGDVGAIHRQMIVRERARLIRHMERGTCEPRDVAMALTELEDGWQAGRSFSNEFQRVDTVQQATFAPMPSRPSGHCVLTSRLLSRHATVDQAADLARAGTRASVFSFSLTSVRHKIEYRQPGVWVQTGGQFGQSVRSGPVWRWCRFARRVKVEVARVEKQRGLTDYGTCVG